MRCAAMCITQQCSHYPLLHTRFCFFSNKQIVKRRSNTCGGQNGKLKGRQIRCQGRWAATHYLPDPVYSRGGHEPQDPTLVSSWKIVLCGSPLLGSILDWTHCTAFAGFVKRIVPRWALKPRESKGQIQCTQFVRIVIIIPKG